MRYHWDVNTLISLKKKLDKLIEKEKNPILRMKYLYDYDNLNFFITQNSLPSICGVNKPNIQEKMESLLYTVTSLDRFYALIEEFCSKLFEIVPQINEIRSVLDDELGEKFYDSTGAYLTHEKTMNLVRDFYRNFDDDLKDIFERIYSDRYKIYTFPKQGKTFFRDNLASHINFPFIEKQFIEVENSRGVSKFIDTIHETGHAIAASYNKRLEGAIETNLFTEVEAIFPELITMTYGADGVEKDQLTFENWALLSDTFYSANALLMHKIIIEAWINNNYLTDEDFFLKLKNEYGISEDLFLQILDKDFYKEAKYILSYAVALELLKIYELDKDKALCLYKQIINLNPSFENTQEILELVPLFSNAQSEASKINTAMVLSLKNKGFM